ncbi:hypothetical protein [Clostridium akagii]|uniref:hypothetical protein n=1 Tax=Clostridium akagii TaxID=91623 RepID=UPI00047AF2EF|nr:hypothetical protein [Clostridium akagii]
MFNILSKLKRSKDVPLANFKIDRPPKQPRKIPMPPCAPPSSKIAQLYTLSDLISLSDRNVISDNEFKKLSRGFLKLDADKPLSKNYSCIHCEKAFQSKLDDAKCPKCGAYGIRVPRVKPTPPRNRVVRDENHPK